MKKKIELVIKKNNAQKQIRESLVSVSRGYAVNYLIPKKNATLPTRKQIQHLKMFENIRKGKEAKSERQANLLRKKVEGIEKISLYKKVGSNNSIFGSITEKEVTQWINKYTNLGQEKIQIQINSTNKTGIIHGTLETKQEIVHKIQINIIPINI